MPKKPADDAKSNEDSTSTSNIQAAVKGEDENYSRSPKKVYSIPPVSRKSNDTEQQPQADELASAQSSVSVKEQQTRDKVVHSKLNKVSPEELRVATPNRSQDRLQRNSQTLHTVKSTDEVLSELTQCDVKYTADYLQEASKQIGGKYIHLLSDQLKENNDDAQESPGGSKSKLTSSLQSFKKQLYLKLSQKTIFGYIDAFTGGKHERGKGQAIHPKSPFRENWDMFILMVIFYLLVTLPLQVGYKFELSQFFTTINVIVDCLFGLDFLLNFMTGYQDGANYILDLKMSVWHYLKGWFWIDLVSVLPFDLIVQNINGKEKDLVVVRSLKLVRIVRIVKLYKMSSTSLGGFKWWQDIKYSVRSIIRFVLILAFVAHLLACIWNFLATLDDYSLETWIVDEPGYEGFSFMQQYTTCMYYAITTMATIGYGDIKPHNHREKFVSIISMFVGSLIYAYGITQLVRIVSNLDMASVRFRDRMDQLQEYMQVRHLPTELKEPLREFYLFKKHHSCAFQREKEILLELPDSLRQRIMSYINAKLADGLRGIPLFEGLDEKFLQLILTQASIEAVPPNETIILEGSIGTKLYFINKGTCKVSINDKVIAILRDGQAFGEIALCHNRVRRSATVQTVTYCEICALRRKDIESILSAYPQVQEQIRSKALEVWEKYKKQQTQPDPAKQALAKLSPNNEAQQTLEQSLSLDKDDEENADEPTTPIKSPNKAKLNRQRSNSHSQFDGKQQLEQLQKKRLIDAVSKWQKFSPSKNNDGAGMWQSKELIQQLDEKLDDLEDKIQSIMDVLYNQNGPD